MRRTFVILFTLITSAAIIIQFWPTPLVPKTIVSGQAVRGELERMNRVRGDWYCLDHAKNDLIVAHNSLYAVVIKRLEENWTVTQLLNPMPFKHYNLQGSTVSSVRIDAGENFIAIQSTGIDGVEDTLYIFDLNRLKFSKHKHNAFPANLEFNRSDNTNNHTGTNLPQENVVKPKYEPFTSVYLYDENTIVYMYSKYFLVSNNMMGENNRLGEYRICFQNISTGEVQEIQII